MMGLPSVEYLSSPDIQDSNKMEKIEAVINGLKVSDSVLMKISEVCMTEMEKGLEYSLAGSCLQMEDTFVTELLDGSESGQFLALDLGGTAFRVILLTLNPGNPPTMDPEVWRDNVPEHALVGTAENLMDYIAASIFSFLKEKNMLDKKLPLGFTFSFPMKQKSLKSGILVTWTKTFRCSNGVGLDAVALLQDAIARHGGFNIEVVAILNDTTGTLMAGCFIDRKCRVGMILGTGHNICYVDYKTGKHKQVAIDSECGAFGDNGCLDFMKTEFDKTVNETSNHVNSFTFEKMISGQYLGELVRCILLKLHEQGLLFAGLEKKPCPLITPWKLPTSYLSDILGGDATKKNAAVREICSPPFEPSEDDVAVVHYVSQVVSTRAAHVVAAELAAIVRRVGLPEVTVAVDGSLYQHHPQMRATLDAKLVQLVPDVKISLILAHDGSGIGAGLVAAVASRMSTKTAE